MYCTNCGQLNPDTSARCSACGMAMSAGTPMPPPRGVSPPNHLVWAILATLFCCLPGGIVAIVYAAQVETKFNAGDLAGAQAASDNAKQWSWISFAVGLVVMVGWVGLAFLGALAEHA